MKEKFEKPKTVKSSAFALWAKAVREHPCARCQGRRVPCSDCNGSRIDPNYGEWK